MPAPRPLAEAEADVARDLDITAHPRAPGLEAKTAGGETVLDCLIIGGGQCGLAVAHAVKRDKADKILVADQAEFGLEGPWMTYARMGNRRSLKDQTGPNLRLLRPARRRQRPAQPLRRGHAAPLRRSARL